MEIKFKRDTSFRKQFFVPDSFAHPAKMDAQLLIWLTENYSSPGETILDPMAGSGTMMLACTLGRCCVLVELEEKFCKMMTDNWQEVKMRPQLGYSMGDCQIIQGDSRNLEGLLCDKIITSPPYAETGVGDWQTGRAEFQAWVINELATKGYVEWQGKRYTESEWRAMNHGRIDGRTTKGVHKHPTEGYGKTGGQIGNLPYGDIDKIITSPPYAEAQEGSGLAKNPPATFRGVLRNFTQKQGDDIRNVSNLPYGNIDKIITSPPYQEETHHTDNPQDTEKYRPHRTSRLAGTAGNSGNNIGNLKGDTYLEAMAFVYSQCFTVLRDGGLLILVTKNFIRNKQVIRLDEDTKALCEQAGFNFVERHFRRLPAQSFWRTIYQQKYPDVEVIQNEDILVFNKP